MEPASDSGRSGDDTPTIVVEGPAEPLDADGGGAPDASLGRYVVLAEVGRGAMGRVLRAYDPKLQREVALKIVHGAALGEQGTQRLVQEARAMAKLSHANVVAVYDVEVLAADRLILVMEYVAGQTLRTWLRERERSWREVVSCFVAAGRGLAAAHDASLLHRDFKPANVLVGTTSGLVKVTDFGLAKRATDASVGSGEGAAVASSNSRESLDSIDAPATRAGLVMGTPRYMAPEQHRGEALGPAADQYAFCVALWEALCREPPFTGSAGVAAKQAGPPPWPGKGVPRVVVEAIRRGLAPDPERRWPSMARLLEALTPDRASRSRHWVAAIGGVGALVGVWWARGAVPNRCTGAATQLVDVWDAPRRAAVQAAILAVDVPYAGSVWARTAERLDAHAAEWVAMHTEACEATTLRGEQSAAVLDLRMACLHRAKVELQAVTAVFASADAAVVDKAHLVVDDLRPLSRCADVDALKADVEPPLARESAAVDAIRVLLAQASAERSAGRYAAAEQTLQRAASEAAALEYGPIHGEVALARGAVLENLMRYDAAEAALREALASAATWRRWDAMAESAMRLMHVVGALQRKFEAGLRYREVAEALAQGDPWREAGFHSGLANVLGAAGKHDQAEAEHRRALALREQLGPGHPEIALSHGNLAATLRELGRYAEAEVEIRRALALRLDALGPEHPDVAAARGNLAAVLYSLGRYAEAEAEFRRSLAGEVAALGPEHPAVAMSRDNLGSVLRKLGRHEEAEAEHRQALATRIALLGADHPDVASSRNNLGNALRALGRYDEAAAEHRLVLAAREKLLGPDHPSLAGSHNNLGNVLRAQGKLDEAETHHRRAWAIWEKALGPDHPNVALGRDNLGEVLREQGRLDEAEVQFRAAHAILAAALGADHPDLATSRTKLAGFLLDRGRPDDALAMAEAAWVRRQRDDATPADRGQTAFVLARALWVSSHAARAIELAERARDEYARAGDEYAAEATEVRAWLGQHAAR